MKNVWHMIVPEIRKTFIEMIGDSVLGNNQEDLFRIIESYGMSIVYEKAPGLWYASMHGNRCFNVDLSVAIMMVYIETNPEEVVFEHADFDKPKRKRRRKKT